MNLPIHGGICGGIALAGASATMLRLTSRRRAMLGEKVPDLANLILASTFLGQFLAERPFSAALAVAGLVIWAGLAVFAFKVADSD